MVYGNGTFNKYEYACTLGCSLAYLVLRQQDAVGCVAFDEKIRASVPTRTKNNHIFSLVESLANQEPRDKTDMFAVLRSVAESAPRRGLMVLVSDLLVDRPGLFKGLKLLRQRGHEVLVFHVMDDDELDFPFAGPTRFEGLELPDYLNCNPRALREGYLAALNAYLDEIRRECARNSCDYALVRTGDALDAALATFLSKRLAVMNRY
jgi:uncharacterized protein (DUF58 family)